MTEDNPVEETIVDPVVQLRDEMQAQFAELKTSFEASLKEKDDMIVQLKEQNTSLQRALVRSAVTDAPKQETPKSEEELYKEKIDKLAERTKHFMEIR